MNLLEIENIILNITKNKSTTNDLTNYLTQIIAEKCGDEIDAAVARSSLQSRSISSSISTGNINIEKRLMHRRLRSTVNYLENLTKFKKFKVHLIKEIENSIKQSSARNRASTDFETLFSVDEFSEDDTLFLTNFSFSQSLKVSKVDNLDAIVGILVNPEIAVEQR
uniref:Uncharacterized protein n=1 Tax=Panagrolaimus davidi TaxID=227884 RepID=A0A914QI36_9BILA